MVKAPGKVTSSTVRKRKAQQRSRKQAAAKKQEKKPSWGEALKRRFIEEEAQKAKAEKAAALAVKEHRLAAARMKKYGKKVPKDFKQPEPPPLELPSQSPAKHRKWKEVLDTKQKKKHRTENESGKPKRASEVLSEGDEDIDDFSDEDAAAEGFEVQDEVDEEKQERLNKAAPLETQVFLRGLPLDITEEQISDFCKRFGPVKRVFLVKHRLTKDPTGSAFVHFAKPKGAETCLAHGATAALEVAASEREAQKKEEEEGLSHRKAKMVQHQLRTTQVENRDPFITIGTSRVTVHSAMSRTQAEEFISSMHKGKKKKKTLTGQDDPRHLYLLHEGRVLPGSRAAEGLTPKFMAMLERDYEERRQQLRNTNYFVSTTRLAFRNLPRDCDEKQLRQLCLDRVRQYLKLHPEDKDKSRWGKFGPIKQLRIIRDNTGTSRGFGFAEFAAHPLALHALRALNNNPEIFGPVRRPVVSFAVEDANAMEKMKRKREKFALQKSAGKQESMFPDAKPGTSNIRHRAAAVKAADDDAFE